MLVVFKVGGAWDTLATMFKINTATFQRLILKFVATFHEWSYEHLVKNQTHRFNMDYMRENKIGFKHFPEAKYATDVIFQHSNRPCGNVKENRHYFSGKHHLYGLKTEVSVLPNGIAIGCSKVYPGSVADITIFRKRLSIHKLWTEKDENEVDELQDLGEMHSNFPKNWALLADKGYHGIQTDVRAIIPKKKPVNGALSSGDRTRNANISHDRVIVENFFGRLCTFGLFAQKWRWDEDKYTMFFQTGVALTNVSIMFNGLRASDISLSTRVHNRLATIGGALATKRAASQAHYRENRKRRLSVFSSEDMAVAHSPSESELCDTSETESPGPR